MKILNGARLAWGGVLSAGVLWGGGALVAQHLIERGISPYSLALARFSLGLPLLWWWHLRAAAGASARWRDLARRQQALMLGAGLAMALNVSCWFEGVAHLGAAIPTVISICCAPVIVAMVSVLRGYEPASRRLFGALALALIGVAWIALPVDGWQLAPGHGAGLAWSLASAALYATVVLCNARMPASVSPVAASTWGMTSAAACMALLASALGVTWPSDAGHWLGIAYTGVVTTSVAYLAFAWGSRRLSPTAAVIGTLVEPLVATLLMWLLWDAPMLPRQWIGALLLGAAMGLLALRTRASAAAGTN